MRETRLARAIGAMAAATIPLAAHAISFEGDTVSGDFTSTITTGIGVRTKNPAGSLVVQGNPSGVPGDASAASGIGDQGDINYAKGDPFTAYLKGSHELVLKFPDQFTFMGRVNWLKDFAATQTTGNQSTVTGENIGADGLSGDARKDMRFKARLMDLWVSKTFDLGGQQARVRVGNQVISWGESLFFPGGINQTNAIDINRLSQPGTQIKEAVLPAPIASFATGLGGGVNVEAYVQARWNANYFPPVGSYWSQIDTLGRGDKNYGVDEVDPKKTGQWGFSARWQPESLPVNFGAYAMSYTDKTPELSFAQLNETGRAQWIYPENRKLFGVSANMPVGDWAVGTELSYRPRDAVSLNAATSLCSSQGGHCWKDEERLQWHLTGVLSLSPSNARGFLDLIGADGAYFLSELAVIRYPNLKQSYGGDLVDAGLWGWGNEKSADPTLTHAEGTRNSSGFAMDFSVTYDGTVIPGWQLVPEIYYSRALSGHTPNIAGTFMKGAQSANLTVSLLQNPLKWQFGVNYAKFWGGSSVFDQALVDRDFVGLYAAYNF